MAVETISYNSWKTYDFCGWKFKIEKVDGIRLFIGNEFSSFGLAIHKTTEKLVLKEKEDRELGGSKEDFDAISFFLNKFEEELEIVNIKSDKKFVFKTDLIKEMREQGKELVPLILPALKEYFGNFNFVASEQELRQALEKSLHKMELDKDQNEFYLNYIKQTDFHRHNRSYHSNRS